MRKLQVSLIGRWYLVLTVALGVAALTSGNNILYLIESLLLSSIIFSGILSERTISALQVEFRQFPAVAGQTSQDRIYIKNRKNFPLFCVEIGEWKNGVLTPFTFIPKISPLTTGIYRSEQVFSKRGLHQWNALAVATSYPFGFAKKIRMLTESNERLIWPGQMGGHLNDISQASGKYQSFHAGIDVSDGEIRTATWEDDSRLIVWPLSARGGEPLVRCRRAESDEPEASLDLRCEAGEKFEKLVEQAARPFLLNPTESGAGLLTLIDWNGRRKILGRTSVLNQLALIAPEGEKPRARADVA